MASSTANPRPFEKRAADYGCTELVPLNEKLSSPSQLDYLDLLPTRSNQKTCISAVAEHQGTALLYLVDGCGSARADAKTLAELQKQLANRSDPAWLGIVQSGQLEIYPIGFHEDGEIQPVRIIERQEVNAPVFFQSLVHGTFEENKHLRGTDYVFNKIFALLTQTTNAFVPSQGKGQIDALEVLSLAGRALFFRFLIDRRIVLPSELGGPDGICPDAKDLKDTFSSAKKAAKTSAWLDATFNGDFLPLIDEEISEADRAKREKAYLAFFKRIEARVGDRIYAHLHAILRGWEAVGESFQMEFDWDELEVDWGDLDFAHIPVGVLSQVYESFSHRADPRTAKDTSVHYTPRTIAGLMVDEAFVAVEKPDNAKVLDSACGAGIFLVLAFRRLVKERWKGGERPKTKEIQEILYNQIRGFDISESALRLAALSLYITAIELNATQRPPHALKFPRNLRNEVLYRFGDVGRQQDSDVMPLGSLGPEVPEHFDKHFDIVIGNPPWTRLRDRIEDDEYKRERKKCIEELNDKFTSIGRRVLGSRDIELPRPYVNPDYNPDLPFLWRAMEWGKPNAVVALAMPARLFGRMTGVGFEAWRAVLRSVQVTGVISGADLRWSAVWKDVKVPFCLFFARNDVPSRGHSFRFSAPINEPDLNRDGRFRIDYEAAHAVSAERAEDQPWLLKALSLGTFADVDLTERLLQSEEKTLAQRWAGWDATGVKTGKGFDRSPNQKQTFVDFLGDLPVFERPNGFDIDFASLKTYAQTFGTNQEGQCSGAFPRTEELYTAPVVIVPQSPGKDPKSAKAFLSPRKNIAFSQSFYGYSCAGLPDSATVASLIYLLPHSTLFEYFCLMTSRRAGFDRQTFNKEEFDALPFPDVSALDAETKKEIRNVAQRLHGNNNEKPWGELNELIFQLYGLDVDDVQTAEDTLFSAASYRRAGRLALESTDKSTRSVFMESLTSSLSPYFEIVDETVAVREAEFHLDDWQEPWIFLSVSCDALTVRINPALMRKAMEAANKRGCSRIIVNAPNRQGIVLGLLDQRRCWTTTRARLCAQYIIRKHLGACGLPEDF